ncbi:EAL domain-containing protein [Duganella sp. FT92W]|uniref:EAL domain-containing protein n=1 Tax=Pseudoduganella rivuli TaxID=2666085 RepID=A0A7X2IUN2_9BURK|nr:EAL domain-containing protein [Pseudoduganella rivuli]MRV76249.1 EAL domain-containing protein [Pseudoduganella rivuli]
MAPVADFHARLARLSLAARLRAAVAAVALPMGAAAALALVLHVVTVSLWETAATDHARVAELVSQSAPLLRAAGGVPEERRAALAGLRAQMRDAAALSDDAAVRAAAQAVSLATYDHESVKAGAAPLAPLLDRVALAAARASAHARRSADTAGNITLVVLLLAPALAAAGGIVLARAITRGIDGTLRECIAFAGDIAAGNFRHGGAHARPGARARRMHAPADSASEFDVLVRKMNGIAEETLAAAEREVEHVKRLEGVERSWALLSACSRSLVKAPGEAALTDAICHHLVELGGYRIAWVGYARDDDGRTIEPVSHAGTDRAYVDALQLSWGADVHRHGGFGTAIQQRRMLVCKSMHGDLVFTSWKSMAPPHGIDACIALPLLDGEGPIGVLGLYAADAKGFTDEEIKLLQDLADDLAFGIASRRDHALREQVEDELAHHTNYDGLTGLATVSTLQRHLAPHAAKALDGHRKVAAIHVNIDRFREVNQALGRDAGDRLLMHVAQRLQQACGHHALLARAGPDEFIAVLPGIAGSGNAAAAASRFVASLRDAEPGTELAAHVSVGIAIHPDDGGDADALLRHAALAMQEAKRQGGNAWRFYAKETNARMAARQAMEAELHGVLGRAELELHYQPQCSLVTGAVTGVEALLRWRHPARGLLAPGEFLGVADEAGLAPAFGAWAIDAVCAQLQAWRAAGLQLPPVALNLGPRQFHHHGLVETIRSALQRHQVPEKALELEITESALMRDTEESVATLRALHELGVRIALDDFGTGYSSLNQLRRLPVDHVKIDETFVRGIVTAPDDAAACNGIISLAHSLHFAVIAKGVETEEQMNYLRRRHCEAMQGFLFSRAVPADALAALLQSGRRLALADHGDPQRTIVLLDDEPAIVRALNRALRQDGYKILAATNSTDALKLLANNPVQVILADQHMPDITGVAFMQRIKDLYPATVRIILSSYADLEPVLDAINRGAIYRFFPKPWNDDELRACIHEAFRHHTSGQA